VIIVRFEYRQKFKVLALAIGFSYAEAMKERIEINQMNSLLAIAETGSLSAAAVLVGRSQAAVSQQMKTLESTCNCALLERTTRGVELTPQGRILSTYAQQILGLHAEALSRLRNDEEVVELRLGVPDEYTDTFVPRLVDLISMEYTQIRLRLHCAPSAQLQKLLGDNELDVVILTKQGPAKPTPSTHKACWISKNGAFPAASVTVPLAISHPNSIDAELAFRTLNEAGRKFTVMHECSSPRALLSVIRSGAAIGIISVIAVPQSDRGMIVQSGAPILPLLEVEIATQKRSALPDGLYERMQATIDASLKIV